MMDTKTKKTLVIGAIILLIVINISALATIYYNNKIRPKKSTELTNLKEEVRIRGMHRFIREELKLSDDQFVKFKEVSNNNMSKSHDITLKLSEKRLEMINEIAKDNPNTKKLDGIAKDIGILHYELKKTTIRHFLELKEICNEDQLESLQKIFIHMIQDKNHDNMDGRGRRRGKHRNREDVSHKKE